MAYQSISQTFPHGIVCGNRCLCEFFSPLLLPDKTSTLVLLLIIIISIHPHSLVPDEDLSAFSVGDFFHSEREGEAALEVENCVQDLPPSLALLRTGAAGRTFLGVAAFL